ncbi:butyrophilin subfamily 3 member A2-like [Cheilinus undulatus]|uniref:butyrophilin subfamily 3 member A2-like n=1 Tax=Cheilinus undulatus TaxID=241271 RepID=UPI001BD4D480|nr:butyrophilin subfamily 3 member A2-like [Cheilinus undulatus]
MWRPRVSSSPCCLLLSRHSVILLILSVKVRSELVCSDQPIIAQAGDDVILPCHFEPAINASSEALLWTRRDLKPELIHFYEENQLMRYVLHPSFVVRTETVEDELKHGNVSLKINNVRPSDTGTFSLLLIGSRKGEASVQLFVVPTLSIDIVHNETGRLVVQCKYEGWHPGSELLWLDGSGNTISAGSLQSVGGPDDHFTVSNLTVEKKDGDVITCRVQLKNINQRREAQIRVPEDFFEERSFHLTLGISLTAALALMLIIVTLVIYKTRRH